jgi:hypothetical protein
MAWIYIEEIIRALTRTASQKIAGVNIINTEGSMVNVMGHFYCSE